MCNNWSSVERLHWKLSSLSPSLQHRDRTDCIDFLSTLSIAFNRTAVHTDWALIHQIFFRMHMRMMTLDNSYLYMCLILPLCCQYLLFNLNTFIYIPHGRLQSQRNPVVKRKPPRRRNRRRQTTLTGQCQMKMMTSQLETHLRKRLDVMNIFADQINQLAKP